MLVGFKVQIISLGLLLIIFLASEYVKAFMDVRSIYSSPHTSVLRTGSGCHSIPCRQHQLSQYKWPTLLLRPPHQLFFKRRSGGIDAASAVAEQVQLLTEAAEQRSVSSAVVAQLLAEIRDLSANLNRIKSQQLQGHWELIFSTLLPMGYFPICEQVDFFGYSVQSSWGPIPLGEFSGTSTVRERPPAVVIEFITNRFSYRLSPTGPLLLDMEVKPSQPRSYSFLLVDETIAVAESSSGGLTLLKRLRSTASDDSEAR